MRRRGVRRSLPWLVGALCAAFLLSGLFSGLPSVNAQSAQSVFALPGTLRAVEGKDYSTALATFDGNIYGLVGQTPAIELEIIRLRNLGPAEVVKVWGMLHPTGLTSPDPEIVVESILSATSPATPTPTAGTPAATPVPATPTPGAPQATVAVENLNVRNGPSTDYSVGGTISAGTTCAIIGRNANSSWWNIRCANGLTGWVSAPLVTVSGSTADIPVVNVAPPPPTPTPPPVVVPPVSGSSWSAVFFNNPTLSDSPAAVTQVADINFNWGTGAPLPNVNADNFSARFERVLNFPTGSYLIEFRVDDGVRLFIDGTSHLENWQIGSARTVSTQRTLSGNHTFRIEYFEAAGDAILQMTIRQLSASQDWQVSYWDNPQLAGNPVLVRGEPRGADRPINLNWAGGSPVAGIVPNDRWSARFEGRFGFEGGDYQFNANVDDGVRVYINGIRVLDAWRNGPNNTSNVFRQLGPGNHLITVEYFEDAGDANLRVWWDRVNSSGGGGGGGGNDRPRDD